jgi:hypothetical protein
VDFYLDPKKSMSSAVLIMRSKLYKTRTEMIGMKKKAPAIPISWNWRGKVKTPMPTKDLNTSRMALPLDTFAEEFNPV